MNRSWKLYGTAVLLLILFDLPWLLLNADAAQRLVFRIQGSDLKLKMAPAFVVYLALAYLVTKTESVMEAFKVGMAVYAVYDFTNLAMFSKYPVAFALMDTVWGGVLMALVRMALDRIF